MRTIFPLALTAVLLLSGCSNKAVPTSEYLLRPGDSGAPVSPDTSVVLAKVSIPPYLDQPGVVIETAPREINAARHHRWAEPLEYALERYLRVTISRSAGMEVGGSLTPMDSAERRIDVAIHQLHATASGDVELVAEWRILDLSSDSILVQDTLTDREPLAADGYPSVIAAHERLLNRLAAAIAADLAST